MALALIKDVGSIILTNRIAATSGFQGVCVYSATKAVVALDRQQRISKMLFLGLLERSSRYFQAGHGVSWFLVTRSPTVPHLCSLVA
jgi:hypothetical protein